MAIYNSTDIEIANATNDGFMILNVAYWEQVLTAILIGLIAIVGLAGNSMIIIAVALSRKLRTFTNVFVTSLAVTDLIASFFMILFMIGVLGNNDWPIPQAEWLCVLTGFMVYACTWTNLFTLAAIAINRLLLITKPFLYHTIYSSWRMALIVACLWLVPSGILIVLFVTGVAQFGYDPADLACAALNAPGTDVSFSLVLCLVGFPIPFLAIVISYAWIYVHLKRHFRGKKRTLTSVNAMDTVDNTEAPSRRPHPSTSTMSSSKSLTRRCDSRGKISQQQIEITKNLFVVVCTFSICFVPFFIFYYISGHILFYARVLIFASSALNFAIYALKHPDFKVVFGHMIGCTWGGIPQPSECLKCLLKN